MQKSSHTELINAAVHLARSRFPNEYSCVAALKTNTGRVLTSVSVEAPLESACLCAETGAICEAHKLNEKITASVCIYWEAVNEKYKILPACGFCQERLAFWGLDVEIAVPHPEIESTWQSLKLRQLRPFYWNDKIK